MKTQTLATLLCPAALALVMGCSQSQLPADKLANTRASVRAAEELQAKQTPRAALHLRLARDQMNRAEQLIRDGDNEEAALYLEQARADAELALALAHERQAREQAQQAASRVEQLQKEVQ